ncbi:phosphoribosylglycinamide formyltransferase [Longibacter salinarum]|uniref:Phosphoribosylglycinamide formyltransferase n=1 Tax=Longibacter salinarum TaxID=1850348 RepID=A0A2A8D1D2_9BACT|nr:phosphoribosylglycinamide formyltransferase [Longibacter salinarum]PEN14772.1 phosphoribosylglycinamide formyltransferase [Longibacter salinarum]
MPRTGAVDPFRLAVFASGGGSNFQSMIDAVEDGSLPAEIALCVSNHDGAGALDRAREHGIPTSVINPDGLQQPSFTRLLLDVLSEHDITFVALAGYLRKIPPAVVEAYHGRMVNIHPALLPAFGGKGMYGMNVHRAVVEYGVHWTGATVHLVDEEYDHGPIVLQQPVPVYPDDTPSDVAARVLNVEHQMYPRALRLFATGRVEIDGRTVRLLDASPAHHDTP